MHLDKPSLAKHLQNPALKGYAVLQKISFAPTESSLGRWGGLGRKAYATLRRSRARLGTGGSASTNDSLP